MSRRRPTREGRMREKGRTRWRWSWRRFRPRRSSMTVRRHMLMMTMAACQRWASEVDAAQLLRSASRRRRASLGRCGAADRERYRCGPSGRIGPVLTGRVAIKVQRRYWPSIFLIQPLPFAAWGARPPVTKLGDTRRWSGSDPGEAVGRATIYSEAQGRTRVESPAGRVPILADSQTTSKDRAGLAGMSGETEDEGDLA